MQREARAQEKRPQLEDVAICSQHTLSASSHPRLSCSQTPVGPQQGALHTAVHGLHQLRPIMVSQTPASASQADPGSGNQRCADKKHAGPELP
jgi:hypothetical protein